MNRVLELMAIPAPLIKSLDGLAAWGGTTTRTLILNLTEYGFRLNRVLPKDGSEQASALPVVALVADPSNPTPGGAVIWLSDGTGAGDDGDLMVKITDTGGTTKTGTIVDYSALP